MKENYQPFVLMTGERVLQAPQHSHPLAPNFCIAVFLNALPLFLMICQEGLKELNGVDQKICSLNSTTLSGGLKGLTSNQFDKAHLSSLLILFNVCFLSSSFLFSFAPKR